MRKLHIFSFVSALILSFALCENMDNSKEKEPNVIGFKEDARIGDNINAIKGTSEEKAIALEFKEIVKAKRRLLQKSDFENAKEIIEEAKEKQTDFCLHPEKYIIPEYEQGIGKKSINYEGGNFIIYYYSRGDIVSNIIRDKGYWEPGETKAIKSALTEHLKKKNLDKRKVVFLDVGANVGWFSLFVASLGFNVIAFEPFPKNVYLMRKSMCLNPQFNMILIEKAVGDKEMRCKLISQHNNEGNGITICDENYTVPREYRLRGEMSIVKLDMFAKQFKNVRVTKMDIESYEPNAIKGGKKVFYSPNSQFLLMEIQYKEYRKKGIDMGAFIREIHNAGFEIREKSFNGPLINIEDRIAKNKLDEVFNIYLVKPDAL